MKNLSAVLLVGALTVFLAPSAWAQWDYGQSTIDNMIDHRLDMRRTRARLEANRKKGRTSSKKSATRRKRATTRKVSTAPSKPAVPALPPYEIEITRDTWQDFGREAPNGFKTNFTLTSLATGKTISKTAQCKIDTGYQTDSSILGVPAGTYMVRAEVPHNGLKYQAHIGSREGSEGNPRGGDFAPAFKIVLKPITDAGGSRVMGVFPPKIYIRVLENSGVK